jgi:hypothetical protein
MKHNHIVIPKISNFTNYEKLKHVNYKIFLHTNFIPIIDIYNIADKNTPKFIKNDICIKPLLNTKLNKLETIFLLLESYDDGFKINLTKFVSLTGVTGYILMSNKLKIYEYCCNGNIYKNNCQENKDSSIIRNTLFHLINYFIHTKSHAIVYSISTLLLKMIDSENYLYRLFNEFLYNDMVAQNDIYGIDLAVFNDHALVDCMFPNLKENYIKMKHLVDLTDTCNFNNKIEVINDNLKCKKYINILEKWRKLFQVSQNFSKKYARYVIKNFTKHQLVETENFLNEAIRICKNSNMDNIPNSSHTMEVKLSFIIELVINQTFIHYYSMMDMTNEILNISIFGSSTQFNIISLIIQEIKKYIYTSKNEINKYLFLGDYMKKNSFSNNSFYYYGENKLNKIINYLFDNINKIDNKIKLASV